MIGIRHEDKNEWEARVPLTPDHVAALVRDHGLAFRVQTSPTRVFPDAQYLGAGAAVVEDLSDCPIVIGVKEIPVDQILPERTYVFFSHTIKGQAANMPRLRRLMELKCQLIDYERIADEGGRRLVFFGRFAGLAGMIDTLHALGRRFSHEGIDTPFATLRRAYEYASVDEAKRDVTRIGDAIRTDGLPAACSPLVCGFAGYGQVSQGAQEIFDLLPVEEVFPADLTTVPATTNACHKVVFREEHMVERVDSSSPFELQEYYKHPERYRGIFAGYLPYLSVLLTGVYWEPKYPRLVTREVLKGMYGHGKSPRLKVIGDISCDIEGAIECTVRATKPDNPVYVYEPATDRTLDGIAGDGPVILAVDNLPCELPADSSRQFSTSLTPFIPGLARTDFSAPISACGLPPELATATIVYHGELTEPYRYLQEYLDE